MGTSSANWRGFRDWQNVNGELRAVEHQPWFHHGTANIDTAYPSILGRSDIVSLHDAAVQSQQSFEQTAASILGSWWTATVAACDAANLTGADHVKVCARMHYRGPITLT